jgi:hypothetical protein
MHQLASPRTMKPLAVADGIHVVLTRGATQLTTRHSLSYA